MAGTAFWWFVTYDRSIAETRMVVQGMVETQKSIITDLHNIDVNGTRFSQRNIDKELDVLKSSTSRIDKLEAIDIELLPKIDRMTWQIANIAEWIDDQKKRQGQHP